MPAQTAQGGPNRPGRIAPGQRTRQLLLSVIRESAPVSRAELSRHTGLSRSAVATAVQRLLEDGLVTERDMPASGRGRPAALLWPRAPEGAVVGIDFGHAHVSVAVADSEAEIHAEQHESLDVDQNSAAALDTAADLVATLLREAGMAELPVLSVVAGIPGPLDAATGLIQSATILSSWVGVAPAAELESRLGCPVDLANDADLGALGELHFGAGQGSADLLYVKASHGIGAGLILNGRLYRGASGIAGEIGHTQLDGTGEHCRCGQRGCLEAAISITEVRRRLEVGRLTVVQDSGRVSLDVVGKDPVAARIIIEAGRNLGRVLADICNCLNPALIVVGGELGTAGRPFTKGIRESITRFSQPAISATVDIRPAVLGHRAELMGAVARGTQIAGVL